MRRTPAADPDEEKMHRQRGFARMETAAGA
jgi:hypothetical protein